MSGKWKQYLLLFAQEHIEFRMPELQSIFSLFDIKAEIEDIEDKKCPFIVLTLPDEDSGQKIMTRTVLGKYLLEIWASAKTYPELYEKLRQCPSEMMAPYCRPDTTLKVRANAFGKTMKQPRQWRLIDEITDVIPFQGKVELTNPEHTFYILEYYGTDPNRAPDEPYSIHFGRWITDGNRTLIDKYSVKKRHFIGNTSMAADLSLIMANQAKVATNSVVLDPFVGTGSLLVACANYGGYVMGTDIDYNVIHGRGKTSRSNARSKFRERDESIRTNLKLYGLEKYYIDVMVADSSRNLWRQQSVFDAIVTDPPYGIRESTRKIGTTKDSSVEDDMVTGHIPSRVGYHLADIFTDLLNFAACYLRLGGRLVYWLPVSRAEYSLNQIPAHPCLCLVANSEQILNGQISRRLITMEKVKEIQGLDDCDATSAVIKNDIYDGHNAIRKKYFIPRSERQKQDKDDIRTETE
ncbi:tRNA (guanine(10)-N(2))-methyltransferase TRMT11-like [Glandiceps talaboti]